MRSIWMGAAAATVLAGAAAAQVDTVLPEDEPNVADKRASIEGRAYPDGRGGEVFFPIGESAFADGIRVYESGRPAATLAAARDPQNALDAPDFDKAADTGYVTLGCGGSLVAQFEDNVIVDVDGDDLYVFEVGEKIEPTMISISEDGEDWIEIGSIGGSTSSVDIGPVVPSDSAYRFVRLEDQGEACGPSFPGADIDAIGAVGAGQRILLQSAVLFGFDEAMLREEAKDSLRSVHAAIEEQETARVVIEGYTDSIGPDDYNMDLSERRADAVRAYLEELSTRPNDVYVSVGRGETRAVASNETEAGQAENRRVEILILTPGVSGPSPTASAE